MREREIGLYIHEEWIGMTQPVGLVVEPTVLDRLGIFPEKDIKVLSDFQRRLNSLFEDQIEGEKIFSAISDFKDFCNEVLGWQDSDLLKPDEFYKENKEKKIYVPLDDYEEILKPDWVVPELFGNSNEKKIQILVKELDIGTPFDQLIKNSDNTKYWEATHQQRFERLLKESENPIGILWNGIAIRLVYAPRGESSGFINFPLEPMITIDGRPMIGALEMLLGPDRLFEGGSSNLRLRTLMEQSRKEQNEVSTRLSEQVLEALWILVRGIDEADQKGMVLGKTTLDDLPRSDPAHIYGGLITVLLRLVFLLYSEDEALMPLDSLFVQNYSVSGLAAKLRQDRIQFQGGMKDRYGAWSSLLSLFRLIFDGGGPYESYLPARHGELFDPDTYPFLEGRKKHTSYKNCVLQSIPLINDDVIEKVLTKLLLLDGQLLSYRALDVEQIGSVYEGIMGFTVEKAKAQSVGILYNPPRHKIKITYVVNAQELLAQPGNKRDKWLQDQAGVDLKLSTTIKNSLKESNNLVELCEALDNKLSPHTTRGLETGSLILQPTSERRRSGSHYTPRDLTEPIVSETFRPWLEARNYKPSAQDILSLKICDPAMGSGAFLVAACRFLASYLVSDWNRNGFPPEFNEKYDKDNYARRLVAQNCLYGVDKNPFAVSLAKLSLWLVTLSRELPFTFVDHALKCGDSLVGYSIKEIQLANNELQLSFLNVQKQFIKKLSKERLNIFTIDNRSAEKYDQKKQILEDQNAYMEEIKIAGDLMVAAFFDAKNNKERDEKQKIYLERYKGLLNNKDLYQDVENILNQLTKGSEGIKPFHWDLEFPEVFENGKGFNSFIGNPPFAGNNTFVKAYPKGILDWLKSIHPKSGGQCDIVAHFFQRSFSLLNSDGTLGLIATNTIAQGDTRDSGLSQICIRGGTIYSATKRFKWPGVASVIASIVHIHKGPFTGQKFLDRLPVDKITAFLLTKGNNETPNKLKSNSSISFNGSKIYGQGFTFDDSSVADDNTPGIPSPIALMKKLIQEDPKNSEVIFPYIGGKEVNDDPTHKHHRYVVDFRNRSYESCLNEWPQLMKLLEKKVKPLRQELKPDGKFKLPSPMPERWWIHGRNRPALYKSISDKKKVIAVCLHQTHWVVASLPASQVFTHGIGIISSDEPSWFALIQSRPHEVWSTLLSSSLGDAIRYTPTDCFETFPFPDCLKNSIPFDKALESIKKNLELTGTEYLNFRTAVMQEYEEGLTKIYNRFNDPNESSENIIELRRLHSEMDRAVIQSYNWPDISTQCGFSLNHFDFELDEESQVPTKVKDMINQNNIFFTDKDEASSFESEIKSILGIRYKLPWRYKWSNQTSDQVLSRLLQLNSQQYEIENSEDFYSRGKRSPQLKKNINQIQIDLGV